MNLYVFCGKSRKKSIFILCEPKDLEKIKKQNRIPNTWEPMIFNSTSVIKTDSFELNPPKKTKTGRSRK